MSCWKYTAACTDPVEQQRCRKSVVTEYLPVARSLAARYSGRGVERGDLEQLAFLGLVKAVRRWEPGRSEDFLQFAVPTIVGEIKRYFRDHSWLVRPPRRIQELRAAITEAEQTHRHQRRQRPDGGRAGRRHRRGRRTTSVEARAAVACCRPRSLDEDQGLGLALALAWGDEDAELRRVEDRVTVQRLLAALTERERDVVHMRFDKGWSQSRIGRRDRRQPDAGVPLAAVDHREVAFLRGALTFIGPGGCPGRVRSTRVVRSPVGRLSVRSVLSGPVCRSVL